MNTVWMTMNSSKINIHFALNDIRISPSLVKLQVTAKAQTIFPQHPKLLSVHVLTKYNPVAHSVPCRFYFLTIRKG